MKKKKIEFPISVNGVKYRTFEEGWNALKAILYP